MGKHSRKITAAKQGDRHGLQQIDEIDDNLLPDAEEIAKLQALDPDIVSWLKARAEQEQSFRHSAHNERIRIIEKQDKREHNTARMGLFSYVLLVIICIGASFILLRENHHLEGSVFGGAAGLLAFAVLLGRRPKKTTNSKS